VKKKEANCGPQHTAVCVQLGVTRKERDRLRVFENRKLRETFGPAKAKVTGEGIKSACNEELKELFPSSNATWMMKWVGHIARMRHKKT